MGCDVLVLSEPNKAISTDRGYICDKDVDTAVIIRTNCDKTSVISVYRSNGFVCVEFGICLVISCYVSPNVDDKRLEGVLYDMQHQIKNGKPTIIAGDLNAKSSLWGSPIENARGRLVADWLAQNVMVVINTGDEPTFVRRGSQSFLDITFCNQKFCGQVEGWTVLTTENLSDHRTITYTVNTDGKPSQSADVCNNKRWCFSRSREEQVRKLIRRMIPEDARFDVDELTDILQSICKEALGKKSRVSGKDPVYWWNDQIKKARERCIRKRRSLTRLRKREGMSIAVSEAEKGYRDARKCLKNEIIQSKDKCWRMLISDMTEDLWGQAYQIVMKKHKTRSALSVPKQMEEVKKLFPGGVEVTWKSRSVTGFPEVIAEEVKSAAKTLKAGKAPGPDGIPAEVIEIMTQERPEIIVKLFNELMGKAYFPLQWKRATVVLIGKPVKGQELQTFRPICLINALGKLYETIIKNRLEEELERKGGLNDRQYGFRKGRSTIDPLKIVAETTETLKNTSQTNRDLLMLITLDIKNAFNCAEWQVIINELNHWRIETYLLENIVSYLSNRFVVAGEQNISASRGVPQGSIRGPLLWNILYDGLLRMQFPNGIEVLAYADDIALLVKAKRPKALEEAAQIAVDQVCSWTEEVNLEIAPRKTECVILIGNRKANDLELVVKNNKIVPGANLKYLGVVFQAGGSYSQHIKNLTTKVEKQCMALARLMPNWSMLGETRRRLLATVQTSTILYAAEVWGGARRQKGVCQKLVAVQRRLAIRVCRGYRTVSAEAIQVLTSMIPVDLLIGERAEMSQTVCKVPRDQREITLKRWENRWKDTTTARGHYGASI